MSLTCPLCRGALAPAGKSYRCDKGHSFDLAKEGYLSLLHGRQKGDGRGDSKAMMVARDRVHRAGVFNPLLKALDALPLSQPIGSLLDLGCGEGFFLGHLVRARGIATSYGLDLSVDAVKLAAKTLKQSLVLRADLLQPLPFADGSLDLVQSIFAPRPLAEIKRVLRPGGFALFVYPAADHWQEIRTFLPLAKIGEDKLPASDLAGFVSIASAHVRTPCDLNHTQLVDVVEMSPSIHRLDREDAGWRDRLPSSLIPTLSVRIALFRKE